MTVEVVTADRGHVRAVLQDLRRDDALEMDACDVDRHQLPDVVMRHKVFAFCAVDYELGPIAVWGMTSRRSGVGAGFAFGTDDWGKALRPMTRNIRDFVLPFLLDNSFHRVEAAALAWREDVARFMTMIGAKAEGYLRGYGSGMEDFISYRWLAYEYSGVEIQRFQAHEHTAH